MFQDLQETSPAVAQMIRGYNFSEKILVDFDEGALEAMHEGDDDVKEAGDQQDSRSGCLDRTRAAA